eukprot:TRINITY_DN2161_c0_g1_i2.p1 TRINITY_DN2161_c0_g1~~TRINITY_DN2161_c0_g1_i2.p1  ORF type:complete len:111 (+),score=22.15 TRINITY_DN2161_c0_g1_i2:106-438(+)
MVGNNNNNDNNEIVEHFAGCHCGKVKIKVLAPKNLEVRHCNCTICNKKGYLHLIVNKDSFELLQGEDDLTNYQFNTKTAKHYFCSTCGKRKNNLKKEIISHHFKIIFFLK